MDKWQGTEFFQDAVIPQVVAIILIVAIMVPIAILYYLQVKKLKPNEEPTGLVLIIHEYIQTVQKLVVDTFGPRFVKLTPYFLFLLAYLVFSNVFAIFGIKEPTTSYTVPLTLGLITWCGSIFFAIKYQRLTFLKSFFVQVKIKNKKIPVMINPLELLGKVTPLISLTFRLWGNIFAGAIIYAAVFWACSNLPGSPAVWMIIIGGLIIMPFLSAYLSLFTGMVQAYVFTLLTMTYWASPIKEAEQEELEKKQHNKNDIKENLNV